MISSDSNKRVVRAYYEEDPIKKDEGNLNILGGVRSARWKMKFTVGAFLLSSTTSYVSKDLELPLETLIPPFESLFPLYRISTWNSFSLRYRAYNTVNITL